MKRIICSGLLMIVALTINAQEKELFSKPKFSGYIMGQYQYSGQDGAKSNSFNIRMLRLSATGRILDDFEWKVQGQINGNTASLGNSPRLVDAFLEWQKYDYFRIKAGQFKRPFTFENPMHPIDQGFMCYAQNVSKLSGFNDRVGEQASNGRDQGIQIQGNLLKNKAGRALLHYQVGIFNGQGINTKDVDNQKDIIGGIWVMPVSGMRIGVFGWTGSYARKGTYNVTAADGTISTATGLKSVDKRRYAISAEYMKNDWTFRSEYIHSTGYGFSSTNSDNANINYAAGDKADGYYALLIAPIKAKVCHVKARYDMYRSNAEWNTCKTFYEAGADYELTKDLQLNVEYAFVNDRSIAKHNYNMVDVEMDVRF